MVDFKIKKVFAREVLDSRGKPTVEVDVFADCFRAREMVPSGASTGANEALELRDKEKRFHGMGVSKAVNNVNNIIAPKLVGMDVTKQEEIDNLMLKLDGTPLKSKLGANAILGTSLSCARAAALCQEKPFFEFFGDLAGNKEYVIPTPFMNVINGGAHADNRLDFQEYMIIPCGKTFTESLMMGSEIYYGLRDLIKKKYGPFQVNIGDEGGFCPNIDRYYEPLNLLMDVFEKLGYEKNVKLAIDAAATEFFKRGKYEFDGKRRDANGMMEIYEDLISHYPIVSLEDPFQEEGFDEFADFLKIFSKKNINIVGDDLLCTNQERIKKAIEMKSCNALLLKLNQIGTVTESINAAELALKNGWDVMVSHRSGETEDHILADFAVGLSTGQIKTGAPCRGERTAKYNQLLRIEERLGSKAKFPGLACIGSCR